MFKGRCEDIERRDKDVQGESRSNVNKGEAHSKQVDHCSKQIASRHPLAQLQSETLVYQVSMPSMPPHQIEQDHGDKYCSTVNQSCRVLLRSKDILPKYGRGKGNNCNAHQKKQVDCQ